MPLLKLILAFFAIAMIYASAGFGGGSSYLAMMGSVGISREVMKTTALVCNIVVVMNGSWIHWRAGSLDFKKMLPLIALSVPMVIVGSWIPLSDRLFFLLLGGSLILAAIALLAGTFIQQPTDSTASQKIFRYSTPISSLLGAGVGLLSGMVAIGGGIFLSPILNLLRWDTPKRIAATAAFFILVNSIAGLVVQFNSGKSLHPIIANGPTTLSLMLSVFIGGRIGSTISVSKLTQSWVVRVTAILVFAAGANILRSHLGMR